jgi:hypothetical protein
MQGKSMRKLIVFLPLLLVSGLLAAAPSATSPKDVMAHHINVVKQDDVDGILQDYADSSVVVIEKNTYIGLASIRKFFEGLKAQHRDWSSYVVTQEVADQGVVFQKEVKTGNVEVFVVRSGKIAFQTTAR